MLFENLADTFSSIKKYIEHNGPLVHCLTNNITMNDNANILLAVGASPIMADHPQEVLEIVSKADSLLINIGNINDTRVESIFVAGLAAKKLGIPIIFDPVGVACSTFRYSLAERIIRELKPQIIKGNMSEIKKIALVDSQSRGVDVAANDAITPSTIEANLDIVTRIAKQHKCTVIATGTHDLVANQTERYVLSNGSKFLECITGTGCMCGALISAYASTKEYVAAGLLGITIMNVAAELAEEDMKRHNLGIGSFKLKLFDYIFNMQLDVILNRGEIKWIK